ncbi:MAG TPA: phenylalanine--tRNA ligase subunit beta, partial [Armatimonadota bacterium]|nr:phenylalanine--tRNA ligase subunit beta [Armatimonadota bacterium]
MRVPYSWLKEHLVWDGSHEGLAYKLTMAGVEVEEIREWSDGEAEDLVFITSVTANRGDLLSMTGLARHGAATLGTDAIPVSVELPPAGAPASDDIAIEVVDAVGCPRYSAMLVRGVKIGESPKWLQRRLLAAGMRPINNIVDCTNYVMWELGQPLHAFDAALIGKDAGGKARIIVRRAGEGEAFTTLDLGERKLKAGDVVIADPDRAVAIAGVMGGANSEVSDATTDVLIESAHFDPVAIRKTAMRLGMSTEASYRFERVVDPEGTVRAAQRCAQLIVEAAGGELAEGAIDCYPGRKDPLALTLRPERAKAIIGADIPAETQAEYLRNLGMEVTAGSDGTQQVVVPAFRPDIEREIDLIEEITIVHGYENVAGELPGALHESGTYTDRQRKRHRLRDLLQAAGLFETINVSMIHPKDLTRVGLAEDAPERNMLALQRPTDEGLSSL